MKIIQIVLIVLIGLSFSGCDRGRYYGSVDDAPRDVRRRFVPPNATNVVFRYYGGDLLGFGQRVEMVCQISEEDLFAFAKGRDYALQQESLYKNDCQGYSEDETLILGLWEEFNPDGESEWQDPDTGYNFVVDPQSDDESKRTPPKNYSKKIFQKAKDLPKAFWAYNVVTPSRGGLSVLYDIQTKMLYLVFSSN